MTQSKIRNVVKYRYNLFINWYYRQIKYHNIDNEAIKDLAIRYDIYKKMKKKYKNLVIKNNLPSSNNNSNKIWICWLQGRDNAPLLIQKCIDSVEKNLKAYQLVILTWDNYQDYVDIPDYIMERVTRKEISLVHFSDILRLNVLIKYGGIWMDSTVLCSTNKMPSYIYKQPLFVFKEINLNPLDIMPTVASSWFIAAGPNNNILVATRDMLYAYWRKENFLNDYFLFHIFFRIATEIYDEEWEKVPTYNNINPHMLQFELSKEFNKERWNQLINISPFHKLSRHVKITNKKFSNYDYILNDFKVKNK